MIRKRTLHRLLFVVAAGLGGVAADAHAIVGRPLTPVSYAGVAYAPVYNGPTVVYVAR